MILVKPSFEILNCLDGFGADDPFEIIEIAGRTCYKSELKKGDWEETKRFVSNLIKRGHESVIEHFSVTVKFIVDRGVSHELVRHRLCSFSQESTRYCNYSGGVTFVIPPWVNIEPGEYESINTYTAYVGDLKLADAAWFEQMYKAEKCYQMMLKTFGWTPQQARSVLPNSLKTEIVMTANLREWRHVLKLRTSQAAHPQMREIMVPLLVEFRKLIPVVFDDLA